MQTGSGSGEGKKIDLKEWLTDDKDKPVEKDSGVSLLQEDILKLV